jgi:hypothetical protein
LSTTQDLLARDELGLTLRRVPDTMPAGARGGCAIRQATHAAHAAGTIPDAADEDQAFHPGIDRANPDDHRARGPDIGEVKSTAHDRPGRPSPSTSRKLDGPGSD